MDEEDNTEMHKDDKMNRDIDWVSLTNNFFLTNRDVDWVCLKNIKKLTKFNKKHFFFFFLQNQQIPYFSSSFCQDEDLIEE